MASDNQVSSILLLILIGLAIYFLLNPEAFTGKSQAENFDEVVGNSVELKYDDVTVPAQSQPVPVVQVQQPVQVPVPVVQVQQSVPVPASESPMVSQTLLSEIIDETPKTIFEPKQTALPAQPVASQQMVYDPNVQLSASDINSVANFDPNDENYDYGASDLTSAFMPPLPAGAKPDVVDFKKNNVDNYDAKDFLPKQVNDEWFETDFSLAKYQLNDDKLINTEKYIIGINTVGESLKNASYDIRGTIPNPKFIVSPWGNSTYEPDFNLKPLC